MYNKVVYYDRNNVIVIVNCSLNTVHLAHLVFLKCEKEVLFYRSQVLFFLLLSPIARKEGSSQAVPVSLPLPSTAISEEMN